VTRAVLPERVVMVELLVRRRGGRTRRQAGA
jgi:hypothetical protein